jgi:hypothetical protein
VWILYRPPRGGLDAVNRPSDRIRAQQAPGFCEQKSSNCCASDPGAGVAPAVGVPGAAVPPPEPVSVVPESVPPVDVPDPAVPVPVEPVWLLSGTEPVAPGVAVAVALALGVAVAVAFAPPEPEPTELLSFGIGTVAGGPGTSW